MEAFVFIFPKILKLNHLLLLFAMKRSIYIRTCSMTMFLALCEGWG